MQKKNNIITVQNIPITVTTDDANDYRLCIDNIHRPIDHRFLMVGITVIP